MRKRILFSIISIKGGGAERQIRALLKRLDRSRYRPQLAVFEETPDMEGLIPDDVEVFVCNSRRYGKAGGLLYLFFWYIKLIIDIKPDIIVSFLVKLNILNLAAAKIILRRKVIISERVFTPYAVQEYKSPFFWKTMVRALYPLADKITAVSSDVRDGLVKNFNLPPDKIEVINNGIDIEHIRKQAERYRPGLDRYVLACGRLAPQKGFHLLIEALKDIDIPLVILGEGALEEKLKARARKNRVELILPGYVENPYPYFKNAALFVLSSFYEGFPNVVLEAMACGSPVVAADCPGGLRDIVITGKNALMVKPGRPEKFKEAIMKLLSDSNLAGSLAAEASKTVQAYDIRKTVKKYENILSDLGQ